MQWKDLASRVGAIAPMLGTLLAGPASAAVGGLVAASLGAKATPDAVSTMLQTNPDAAIKLRQIEADQAVKLQALIVEAERNRLAADTNALHVLNATVQTEAQAEKWPTYSWRPFNGFVVGFMAFGCYFVLPLLGLPVPAVPEFVWLMFGGILGVASWFRGKAQVAVASNPATASGASKF